MNHSSPKHLAPYLLAVTITFAGCSSSDPRGDQQPEQAPSAAVSTKVSAPDRSEAPSRLDELAGLDALRDAFNADADKGRAILLLEPG